MYSNNINKLWQFSENCARDMLICANHILKFLYLDNFWDTRFIPCTSKVKSGTLPANYSQIYFHSSRKSHKTAEMVWEEKQRIRRHSLHQRLLTLISQHAQGDESNDMMAVRIFRSGSQCTQSPCCSHQQQHHQTGEQIGSHHAGIVLAENHDTPIHNKIADKRILKISNM